MTGRPPRTLRAWLDAGPLPPAVAVRVAVQLCDGLTSARSRGAADRDVRPDTILFDGAAIQLTGIPMTGARGLYAAPERRRGWSAGDARCDVYVVGVLLYEMLLGRPPEGQFPWPGQVDPAARWLDPIVVRCLADNPDQRFPSPADLRTALLATPSPARPRTSSPAKVLVGIAGVIVGALLVSLVFRMAFSHPSASSTVRISSAASSPPNPAPGGFPSMDDTMNRLAAQQADLAAQVRSGLGRPRVNDWTPTVGDASVNQDTPLAGGEGGVPFRMIGNGDRPVVGLSYALGTWQGTGCMRQVDPLYDRADGDVYVGTGRGGTIVARDGYAVGGLLVDADDANVLALAVVFMACRDGHLVPTDQYTSPWVGTPIGQSRVQLGGDGRTVIGFCGQKAVNLDAVGLVMATK